MIESSTDRPREPWERLLDEPDRPYSAFECYLSMPPGERSSEEAYRIHAGNPHATSPSDTFKQWTKRYDWRERAAAWDDAVRRARRDGVLEGTKDQWGKMSVELERMNADLMHLSERAYLKALEIFEQRLTPENHTLAHAVQMSKLVLEVYKHTLELHTMRQPEEPWPDIPDEEIDRILDQMEREYAVKAPGEEAADEDSEGTKSGPS